MIEKRVIVVHPDLLNSLELLELREAGHTILVLDELCARAYRIFAPNAWRMYGPLLKYLPVAMKATHKDAPVPKAKTSKSKRKTRKVKTNTLFDGDSNDAQDDSITAATPLYPPA